MTCQMSALVEAMIKKGWIVHILAFVCFHTIVQSADICV